MKKYLLFSLLPILFLLFSCDMVKKDYWIAMQYSKNNQLLTINYNISTESCYINIHPGDIIECNYFLLPETTEQIVITSIQYDPKYLRLLSFNEPIISFQALQTGNSDIIIQTKNTGSTFMEVRIIN